jgi:hypothetical protein
MLQQRLVLTNLKDLLVLRHALVLSCQCVPPTSPPVSTPALKSVSRQEHTHTHTHTHTHITLELICDGIKYTGDAPLCIFLLCSKKKMRLYYIHPQRQTGTHEKREIEGVSICAIFFLVQQKKHTHASNKSTHMQH